MIVGIRTRPFSTLKMGLHRGGVGPRQTPQKDAAWTAVMALVEAASAAARCSKDPERPLCRCQEAPSPSSSLLLDTQQPPCPSAGTEPSTAKLAGKSG